MNGTTGAVERLWRSVQARMFRVPELLQVQVSSASPLAVAGADGEQRVQALGSFVPIPGDWVWLLRSPGSSVVIGSVTPQVPPAPRGTVTAYTAGSGVVTVQVEGTTAPAVFPHVAAYTPAVGDTVLLTWTRTLTGWAGSVAGKQTAPTSPQVAPQQEMVPANVPRASGAGSATIPAIQAGSFQLGRWRSDTPHVIQSGYGGSNVNDGFWFYGSGFGQVPRGATVTRARMRLAAWVGGASAATPIRLYLHGSKTRPAGRPAVGPAVAGTAPALKDYESIWWGSSGLVAAVQQIVDGSYAGLCCVSAAAADYTRLRGLTNTRGLNDRDPLSGALDIEWI